MARAPKPLIVLHPVAETYKPKGSRKQLAHHVVYARYPASGIRVVEDGKAVTYCAEHMVTNCVRCGRTPGQHKADEKRQHELGIPFDCPGYEKRPPCKCELPRAKGKL